MTTNQGDLIQPTIAVLRHYCPRMTSRRVSSLLIIVLADVIVNVVTTPPPSDNVHGVHHGATAERGTSNNANFATVVADAATFFVPAILSSCWSSDPWRGRG
jgi:hypothetical protein